MLVLQKIMTLLPKEMGSNGINLPDSFKDLLTPEKLLNLR